MNYILVIKMSMINILVFREYNSPSIQEKNNPLSPRSVFDSLQNRSLMSPVNKAWTVKEASMFSNQMLEPQKAVSPPSGKYFSRIRHCISDDSKPIFATPTIKKCTGYVCTISWALLLHSFSLIEFHKICITANLKLWPFNCTSFMSPLGNEFKHICIYNYIFVYIYVNMCVC